MEPSQWQIAAAASTFDARPKNQEWATIHSAHHLSSQKMTQTSEKNAVTNREAAAKGAFELDWAGNPIRRPSRRLVSDATAVSAMVDHFVEENAPPQMQSSKRHFERNINLASAANEGAGAPMGAATYQEGPGRPGSRDWKSYVNDQFYVAY